MTELRTDAGLSVADAVEVLRERRGTGEPDGHPEPPTPATAPAVAAEPSTEAGALARLRARRESAEPAAPDAASTSQSVPHAPAAAPTDSAPATLPPGTTREVLAGAWQQVQQRHAHLTHMESQLNWEQVRQHHPERFAALRAQVNEERARLNQAAARIRQDAQTLTQLEQTQAEETFDSERRAMLQALPHWRDPERFKAEAQQLADFLRDAGYTREQISRFNARDVRLAHDAWRAANPEPARRSRPHRPSLNSAQAVEREIESRQLNPHGMTAGVLRLAALRARMGRRS